MINDIQDDVEALEAALVSQWALFGRGPEGVLHDEHDLLWVEAPVPQLPYNAVLRTRLGQDANERIEQVAAHFRQRGAQFMWMVHPTAKPDDLAARLAACGLSLVEHAAGMSLDLTSWQPSTRSAKGLVSYQEVHDEQSLRAFEELIVRYWELPEESRPYVFGINRWTYRLGDLGVRLVAYKDGQPIGKAYLSYLGFDDTAAIFGVYVSPMARGNGVASMLTELLINRAVERGRKRVVLHSSEMAVSMYRRMGFSNRCVLLVYATTTLHSLQPS